MTEFAVAIATFVCLVGAAFAGLHVNARLPSKHLQDDTNATVRLIANLFVVMTSLAVGLMMNSARNTLETNNHNVHALATDLILLDRTLRGLGPEADETRRHLAEYVRRALKEANIVREDAGAEADLDAAGTGLRAIRPADDQRTALWNDARDLYRQVVQQRWIVVDESGRTIPKPLIALLICWLIAIFASFGYRAPRNAVVTASIVLAALLMSGTLFLILDMDSPTSGLIQTSNHPFQRALAEFQR